MTDRERMERAVLMDQMRQAGCSQAGIGTAFGISGGRVGQILWRLHRDERLAVRSARWIWRRVA